jgi:hypothetical protein
VIVNMMPILVAFHTSHWVRVAVGSYLEHFPNDRMLVVDNNPRRGEVGWEPHCDDERHWLANHPNVELLERPTAGRAEIDEQTHGAGIDRALEWCRQRSIPVALLLEPDCWVTGRAWRDNLERAIDAGAWMAGCDRRSHGPIHLTPSAWVVGEVRASFRVQLLGADTEHPQFRQRVNLGIFQRDLAPRFWPKWSQLWDAGQKAWFEAALHDRAALVDGAGFRHYWQGSSRRLRAGAIAERFPELRHYLYGPAAQIRLYPVEQCPFRERPRTQEGDEWATCRMLRRISGVADRNLCLVRRDACEECCTSFPPSAREPNPVVASLLYELAGEVLHRHGVPGCGPLEAAGLRNMAEENLSFEPAE